MRGLVANWLWLFVFVAFALGFVVGGWSTSKETPAQQQTERANSAKSRADEKPSPVSQLHSEQGAPKAEEKENHTFWSWIANFFELKLSDVVIAIFTVVLAVKTSGLFTQTAGLREAAEKQRIDSLRSIAASELAAKAAQASAEALPVIEGAYVYPVIAKDGIEESLSAFQHSEVRTNRLRINFYFKNFGKTPANVLLYRAHLVHPDGPNLRSANTDAFRIVQKTTLGAVDHTEPLETEIADFSREEWDSVVRLATSHLYFTGEIRYADIWGNRWQFSFDSPAHGRLIPDNQARRKIE